MKIPGILWHISLLCGAADTTELSENYTFKHLQSIQGSIVFLCNFDWRTVIYNFLFQGPS